MTPYIVYVVLEKDVKIEVFGRSDTAEEYAEKVDGKVVKKEINSCI